MNKDNACWVAYTTVSSREKALEMARTLVAGHKVACVSLIGPVESIYEWNGQIQQGNEWMLMMKGSEEQRLGLESAVCALHDYEVPELIVLAITDGHGPYLEWLRSSSKGLS